MKPCYQDALVTLYHAEAAWILAELPAVDLVLTDPPYPNNAGHFTDGIRDAEDFMLRFRCQRWLVFWDELTKPPVPLPHVATHVWHRNNSNRPDNYEAIYEFNADGVKRASRVLSYPVISPGLTGCTEATGHPTQKNLKLMQRLIGLTDAKTILDPFCGSGTTLEAAKSMGVRCIGIERDARWCAASSNRCRQERFKL